MRAVIIALFFLLSWPSVVVSWLSSSSSFQPHRLLAQLHASDDDDLGGVVTVDQQRRNVLGAIIASSTFVTCLFQTPLIANAVPMVTVDEFGIILRDSPRSVRVVEFSGPKSENIAVQLVDGTTFGIKDVVESSTDPRSPLKVQAACRENGVATKFVDLEAVLAKSTTLSKKKLYTNQRVRDAQIKELERQERIRQDEELRLAQLAQMEKEEAAAAVPSSGN